MNDPSIKIIETLNKERDGLPTCGDFNYTFRDQKIFTVLPEYEILRLYDNVPLKAQAQTLMGNRLMYGNYYEGYNLKDFQNKAVDLRYSLEVINNEFDQTTLRDYTGNGDYTFGQSANITNSIFGIDLGINLLKKGTILTWDLNI